MIIFLLLVNIYAQSPNVVYRNNEAVVLKNEDKLMEAKQILLNQVVENPGLAPLNYNLGTVLEKMNDTDSALKEYSATAKHTRDQALQFQALFNMARIYGEKKDISNALKYYQMALDIKPDSIEVKTNIELLSQSGGSGGGSDENKDSKKQTGENKNKSNQDDQKNQEPKKKEQSKPQPKPFKNQDLSEQDVKRILDELKQQENQIRKKMNEQKNQESPLGKDW